MKKFLALALSLAMVFCLCACGADKNGPTGNEPIQNQTQNDTSSDSSSKEQTTPEFKVTVTDTDGNTVKGVMVQICKDACVPAITDDSGIATFKVEITDGYKLSVMSCPEGYEYTGEAEIYLEEGSTEYTLEITKK